MLRKADAQRTLIATAEPFADHDFASRYPTLYTYMSQCAWDDGSRRLTATLLIFFEEGAIKMCLNDREMNRSVFVSCPEFVATLETLENGLASGRLDWRNKKVYGSNDSRTPF